MSDNKQYSNRRKACNACVRGHRRCDFKTPCSRCVQRHSSCEYPELSSPPECTTTGTPTDPLSPFECMLVDGSNHDGVVGARYVPPLYDSLSTIVTSSLSKPSLNYCLRMLRSCVSTLAHQGTAPFIQPTMWNGLIPSPILEVYAVAASYSMKNSQNENLVKKLVISKADQLARQSYWSFDEHLATMQASLMLQIILLFDGDIQMRTVGESQMESIRQQMAQLLLGNANEISDPIALSPWLRWVFVESVRRTYLMCIFVQALYSNLKFGYCELVPLLGTLPLSVHEVSWNAKSETEWMEVNASPANLVLPYTEALTVWHTAKQEKNQHLAAFQEMLYAACKGNQTWWKPTS